MVLDKNTAQKTADYLLQIKAIKLNSENPFTWASGWKSPIYCDNRVVLSYPEIRNYIAQQMAREVQERYPQTQVIAGVATGAIGMGMLVADKLGLPFIYVRPEPKKHGRQNQIEGALQSGQKVTVIEDLISTGMSSLNAVKALKSAQAEVLGMLAVFSYGFETAHQNFKQENVVLHTLSNYENLLLQALNIGYISENELEMLKSWRENPSKWRQ
ncbi:orotate phosphoribosyltransferase [Capnocytophaga canimorsus]|uniref:Orotate phosphoribosyltransferase n=1 Tax=Capnocytophaga canimorsus TaxID=28188 RepID=A0A0B7H878_9FLAO|nr:orotate phosphoribosyltransferase [Capnocytophaga canimorsus]ATA76623.1 orotate phosphoribosyltransferase [Capnocytophaga canimorsus]ATA91236.1 orotate phosphoribosyltransferase [Capnocytophaga canimorsus]ATA93345.1 orotate phosphoribosyltransferase [Capnocytophaga canimorsus]AWL78083.1 orotate phosphoribosyltransferase [Capnocytophaga canimorsus]AYW36720.1 orotate phosphoribosyltransferase [Capnocytophaga canimorsus]